MCVSVGAPPPDILLLLLGRFRQLNLRLHRTPEIRGLGVHGELQVPELRVELLVGRRQHLRRPRLGLELFHLHLQLGVRRPPLLHLRLEVLPRPLPRHHRTVEFLHVRLEGRLLTLRRGELLGGRGVLLLRALQLRLELRFLTPQSLQLTHLLMVDILLQTMYPYLQQEFFLLHIL